MSIPAHLQTMRDITGTLEAPGAADNPVILAWRDEIARKFPDMAAYCAGYEHDETPWCGLTVAYVMAHNGIRPQFTDPDDYHKFLWAQSWKGFGTAVAPADVQPGDVLVFARHVTLYDGEEEGSYLGRGGNQADSVRVSRYSKGSCQAIRRAPGPSTLPTVAPPTSLDKSGRGSWYSWFTGKYVWEDPGDEAGSNALRVPDDAQGVAFFDHATLGHWFEIEAPNGKRLVLQHTDIGPNPRTNRTIDISAVAAELFGYSPKNFPTNGTFRWRAIAAPAEVAHLTPQQQAVAFRDLRKGSTMTDPVQTPTVIPPPASADPLRTMFATLLQSFMQQAIQDVQQHPEKIINLIGMLTGRPMPTATPQPSPAPTPQPDPTAPTAPVTPTVPALPKWGFGTGILGTALAAILHQQGATGAPIGDGSTLTSLLSFLVPMALSAFGAGGGVAGIIAKIAPSVFAALTQVKKS